MPRITAQRFATLNKVTLDALSEHNKLAIVKKFTEAGIEIMGADFGFAWWRKTIDEEYQLAYKTKNIPFEPNPPKKKEGGHQVMITKGPVFIEEKFKETYGKQFDVSPYMKSYTIVPIVYDDNFYGNIVLCYKELKVFSEADKALAKSLGNSLAQSLNITKLAYLDSLTGIPNRAFLNEKIKEVQDTAQKNNGMYAVFFLDLDRFKVINDIYGHSVGDILLKEVAGRIQKVLPLKATISRMGGDEFLVLLQDLESVSEAEKCGLGILDIFKEYFEINEHELYVNGSVGFSVYPLDGVDYHVLMKNADLALNRAKEHGGGNIQKYRIGQPLFYTMQPKLQSQLRKAIEKGELLIHYQPIVNVKTKRIAGSEALVRWNHPDMGLLYPGTFIGQAEESGLIVQIGDWIVNEVCRQMNAWEEQDKITLPVSINISPRELLRPTLVSNIKASLNKYKIAPGQIKLELTETFLMKNIDLSIGILQQLKSLGLRIFIDDFGTGYASLNYLRRLPIQGVKIDQSFVGGVPVNLQDAALTSAIIAISHQLGLDVVAEGVENLDQLDFLRAAQCNFAQGNYFYKPMDSQSFSKLLRYGHPS